MNSSAQGLFITRPDDGCKTNRRQYRYFTRVCRDFERNIFTGELRITLIVGLRTYVIISPSVVCLLSVTTCNN